MTVNDGALSRLRADFAGELVRPADAGFARARAELVWNGNIAGQPAIIARPTSNEDVAAAISFAQEQGLELAVRGGGHGFAGAAVADGGVTIDLSRMASVRVDPEARRAFVGGGAAWAALDAATAQHGLAVAGGTVSHTGVAGLTLTGGLGWLLPLQGLSCDNLVAATLVTADSRTLTASAENEPELFWALRGAGTNFGVVTQLAFELHPVNPLANLGLFFWRTDDAAEPLTFARDYLFELPMRAGALISGLSAPPEPFVPEAVRGASGVAIMVVTWGTPEEHDTLVEPLRGRAPAFELVTPLPHTALQRVFDESAPWAIRAYSKGLTFDDLPNEAIRVLLDRLPARQPALPALGHEHHGDGTR